MWSYLTCALLLASGQIAQALLKSDIDAVLSRSTYANASVGVQIRRLGTGELVYTHNEHISLVPASNLKLITAALALNTLKSDFRYKTPVLATAKPDADGNLDGDLYLRGSGDPSLTSGRLAILAKQIADAGVKNISGKVIGDGSRFDDKIYGFGWDWDDEPYDYNAQISSLNCDRNVVNVSVSAGKAEGDPVTIKINDRDPKEEPYVEVQSTVQMVAKGNGTSDDVIFDRKRARNIILLSGTIPVGSEAAESPVTIEDPPSFAAHRFALALRDAGVHVSTASTSACKTPADAIEIGSSISAPLSDLLTFFLKTSDNLYGETIYKTIGSVTHPDEPGSADTAKAVLDKFLHSAGIDNTTIDVNDGSGLSRLDSVTVHFFCDLLSHVHHTFPESDRRIYTDALPVSGPDGSLEDRFPKEMYGKVHAKTGSETRVSSLSGYVDAKNGEKYVFSIMMNQARGKNGGTSEDDADVTGGQNDIVKALYYS